MAKEPKRIFLTEDEMPTRWYNVRADMKNKPAPMLHPGTHKPLTLEEMTGRGSGVLQDLPSVSGHPCISARKGSRHTRQDLLQVRG